MTQAPARPVTTVGVAGAGVMGSEVAQVMAAGGGYRVVLVDTSLQALDRARTAIARNLRLQRMTDPAAPAVDRDEVLSRIVFATDFKDFATADFVVENVTEDWDVKRDVYEEIDQLCPPDTVFAVNTSVIPITRVGSATGRPERVIGTHFMNPVSRKPTVEVIRGHHTAQGTIDLTMGVLASIGKEGILVNDSPGFVSNRVLMLTVNEAVFLLQDQVADAEQVDKIFKTCFGHPMGPLETADLIGLDTVLRSIELLYEHFSDSKYRPCPLLRRMVYAGLHGRKSGQGFYSYGPAAR